MDATVSPNTVPLDFDAPEVMQSKIVVDLMLEGHKYSSKRPFKPVKITSYMISEEVQFWSTAVICFFWGANPPLHVIEGFVKRIWKNLNVHKVEMIGKRVFLVHLQTTQDSDTVCKMNGIVFDRRHLDSSISKESLKTVPL